MIGSHRMNLEWHNRRAQQRKNFSEVKFDFTK
jgi:hypothetical protein